MGDDGARMLGPEGFTPTAAQAKDIGLVDWVVPHASLQEEAERIAGDWVAAGRSRQLRGGFSRDELKATNASESRQLADAFLSPPFLMGQFRFLWGKRKRSLALMFLLVRLTYPVWRWMLPPPSMTPAGQRE